MRSRSVVGAKCHGRMFHLKIPNVMSMSVTGNFFSGMMVENSDVLNDR